MGEDEIAKRHVEIAKRRAAELKADPTRDLPGLTEQMQKMSDWLEGLDDQEWTVEATDRLDAARLEAMRLFDVIEAIFDTLEGA
jgi:hypothetical protein